MHPQLNRQDLNRTGQCQPRNRAYHENAARFHERSFQTFAKRMRTDMKVKLMPPFLKRVIANITAARIPTMVTRNGAHAIPRLKKQLSHWHWPVREACLKALAQFTDPGLTAPLLSALGRVQSSWESRPVQEFNPQLAAEATLILQALRRATDPEIPDRIVSAYGAYRAYSLAHHSTGTTAWSAALDQAFITILGVLKDRQPTDILLDLHSRIFSFHDDSRWLLLKCLWQIDSLTTVDAVLPHLLHMSEYELKGFASPPWQGTSTSMHAIEYLSRRLGPKSTDDVEKAVFLLGLIGDCRGIAPVVRTCSPDRPILRATAYFRRPSEFEPIKRELISWVLPSLANAKGTGTPGLNWLAWLDSTCVDDAMLAMMHNGMRQSPDPVELEEARVRTILLCLDKHPDLWEASALTTLASLPDTVVEWSEEIHPCGSDSWAFEPHQRTVDLSRVRLRATSLLARSKDQSACGNDRDRE